MIRNKFPCIDPATFPFLYKPFVRRPHLEYASVTWWLTFKKDIITIENVQWRLQGQNDMETRALDLPSLFVNVQV